MTTSKTRATSIHFIISLVVISFLIGLIVYFWFPSSIIKISNFKEIALLIIGVDLVLGPLLTFIVFKPQKKGLKLDLTLIALVQVSALVFGVYNLYKVHPVYITFNVDRFTLVSAVDARPESAKIDEFKISKLSSPKLVISKLPEDIDEKNKLVLQSLESGSSDFELKSEYYHSIEDNIEEIIEKGLDPKVVFKDDISQEKLKVFINKNGKKVADYVYLPIEGNARDAIWALDPITAQPVGIIDVTPWGQIANNKLN